VLVLSHFSEAGGGFGSLSEVRQLFTNDMLLVAGWVHYLAFDLFIGDWTAAMMDRAYVSRIIQGFILPVIFLFGPAGFLLALTITGGNLSFSERASPVSFAGPKRTTPPAISVEQLPPIDVVLISPWYL